jgi:hypothetical protein
MEAVLFIARHRHCEVKAEAIDVHLRDPVAQAVQNEPQRGRAGGIDRVAAAGDVEVACAIFAEMMPVVAVVVQAAKHQRGAVFVALGGVIVHHVEDHLDARGMQRLHHRFELAHLLLRIAAAA